MLASGFGASRLSQKNIDFHIDYQLVYKTFFRGNVKYNFWVFSCSRALDEQ
jgi:hypothetical protein